MKRIICFHCSFKLNELAEIFLVNELHIYDGAESNDHPITTHKNKTIPISIKEAMEKVRDELKTRIDTKM